MNEKGLREQLEQEDPEAGEKELKQERTKCQWGNRRRSDNAKHAIGASGSAIARVILLPFAVQHVDQMLSWPSAGLLFGRSSIVHPLIHYSELPRTGW